MVARLADFIPTGLLFSVRSIEYTGFVHQSVAAGFLRSVVNSSVSPPFNPKLIQIFGAC
jgi:hypothetical protein